MNLINENLINCMKALTQLKPPWSASDCTDTKQVKWSFNQGKLLKSSFNIDGIASTA